MPNLAVRPGRDEICVWITKRLQEDLDTPIEIPCDIRGAKEPGMMHFPTKRGAKEPRNPQNHRVVNHFNGLAHLPSLSFAGSRTILISFTTWLII